MVRKKKHSKKTRSTKRSPGHKAAKRLARTHHVKRAKASTHAKPEHHSLSLLRAMKRRRAAQIGEREELGGMRGGAHPAHKKRRKVHSPHRSSQHHGEPVITEKSFENMLAYRRFQDHAR